MLDIDEERSAIRQWQVHGDRRALERLIRAHARLAWSIARRWTNNPAHLEDLVAAGMLGLVRAAKRFDRTRDVRFATYSVWWIRNEVTEALPKVRGVIDVPVRAGSTSRAVTMVHGQIALDAASGEAGIELLESLPSDAPTPEERVLDAASETAMSDALRTAVAALPPLEATVITARRLRETPAAPSDLAMELNISTARVRQVETRALGLLRQHLLYHGFNMALLN